jgi:hypothetical protein
MGHPGTDPYGSTFNYVRRDPLDEDSSRRTVAAASRRDPALPEHLFTALTRRHIFLRFLL